MNSTPKIVLLCLILIGHNAFAVEVKNLFETEVISRSENKVDREASIQQALKIVLTRVLAGEDILQNEMVKTVIQDASHYVNEYQYSLATIHNSMSNDARLLRVAFNEKLLTNLFNHSELGYWNEIRPRTLVWLVVEEDLALPRFFNAELMPEIDTAMAQAANQKALPILYPIQDLEEKQALSPSDVLSAYSKHLLNVSHRYDVVSTLAGKLVKQPNCWQAEWNFYFDSKIKQWKSPCTALNKVALNGMQGVYDRLSDYYSVKPNPDYIRSTIFQISNINNSTDIETILDYLEALPGVKTATLTKSGVPYYQFRIFYQGRREDILDTIKQNKILQLESASNPNQVPMNYKFLMSH